jgi:hypothetical protein
MKDLEKTPFNTWAHVTEIHLRGDIATMGADLELLILRIILYCIIDTPQTITRKYKKMTLGTKVKNMLHDLKKHKPHLSRKYSLTLKKLRNIVTFRNKLIHQRIEWEKDQKSYFFLIKIADSKGEETASLERMTMQEYKTQMKITRETIMELTELSKEIEKAFHLKFPNFFTTAPQF